MPRSSLVYDNTAVPRGCHTIFDYQIRGSQNIADEVRLEVGTYEPPISKYGDLIIHLFVCFLINQETTISTKFNLAIYLFIFLTSIIVLIS